jgi:UDPglucose 6-dehydrogenase
MKIGVIGKGIVGNATEKVLLTGHDVVWHDLKLGTKLDIVYSCSYVFICIPTNNDEDIKILLNIVQTLNSFNSKVKIIIRSTIPIGTCKKIKENYGINVYYIPEFLRDRCWEIDCLSNPLLVGQMESLDLTPFDINVEIIRCTCEDLELLKMFSNNLNSLKIVFANHFYDLAKLAGSNYNNVVNLWENVKNEQSYLEVSDSLRGFGGKCLPKDLDFIISTCKQFGIEENLFTSIKQDNSKWPLTVRKS